MHAYYLVLSELPLTIIVSSTVGLFHYVTYIHNTSSLSPLLVNHPPVMYSEHVSIDRGVKDKLGLDAVSISECECVCVLGQSLVLNRVLILECTVGCEVKMRIVNVLKFYRA